MAVGSGGSGIASRPTPTRRNVCRRVRHIRQPHDRVRVVSPGGKAFARHSSTQGSIGIRAHRRAFDPGTNRPGETLRAGLGGKTRRTERRIYTVAKYQLRTCAMNAWFVPPIIIPSAIVLAVLIYGCLVYFH